MRARHPGFFDQVERHEFGAFREMSANSQILRTVRIYRAATGEHAKGK